MVVHRAKAAATASGCSSVDMCPQRYPPREKPATANFPGGIDRIADAANAIIVSAVCVGDTKMSCLLGIDLQIGFHTRSSLRRPGKSSSGVWFVMSNSLQGTVAH